MKLRFKISNVWTLGLSAFFAATLLGTAAPAQAGFLSDLVRDVVEDVKKETQDQVKQTTNEVSDKVGEKRREATDCALGRRDCSDSKAASVPKPSPAARRASPPPSTSGGLHDL